MTSRQPPRRLVDVLKQNSKRTLERHAAELATASSSLPAEAIQTRFLRNQFLINPKALQLLYNEEQLSRWHVFGLYKPPFCPMRRAEAQDNYHHVSVESFVESALRSRLIYPTVRRSLKPSELHVRVVYNLDAFASGPVLVSLSDRFSFARSLATTTMAYDVLVSGHLPVHATGNHTTIAAHHLFPAASQTDARSGGSGPASDAASCSPTATVAYYEVKQNGYYSVHPVSLLNVVIQAPPSSKPPLLERFVREQLGTCIIGDPLVMGELMRIREYAAAATQTSDTTASAADTEKAAAHAAALKLAANPHIVSMRGDCDFPRVFMHLRETRVDTREEKLEGSVDESVLAGGEEHKEGSNVAFTFPIPGAAPLGGPQAAGDAFAQKQGIELHCRKCFDGLVHKQLTSTLKARRISLLDGTWTPQAEFL